MSIEFYIGKKLEFYGKDVVCSERVKWVDGCEKCFFYEDKLCKELICTKERRSDGKDVIFREVRDSYDA